jgi:hypothetical protein
LLQQFHIVQISFYRIPRQRPLQPEVILKVLYVEVPVHRMANG